MVREQIGFSSSFTRNASSDLLLLKGDTEQKYFIAFQVDDSDMLLKNMKEQSEKLLKTLKLNIKSHVSSN